MSVVVILKEHYRALLAYQRIANFECSGVSA